MRLTTRNVTLFRVLTVLAIPSLPIPSYAQNQPAVERVQLPNWDLSDKLDLLRERYPELHFFFDERKSCWVAEGTPSRLGRLADDGIGPGAPSHQNEVLALIATLRELPTVELLDIHYRKVPREEQKWFVRYWDDYPVLCSYVLTGKDKERALDAVAEDIPGPNNSTMRFDPRRVLVGHYEGGSVVARFPGNSIGLPIGRSSAKVLDDLLLHRDDYR